MHVNQKDSGMRKLGAHYHPNPSFKGRKVKWFYLYAHFVILIQSNGSLSRAHTQTPFYRMEMDFAFIKRWAVTL